MWHPVSKIPAALAAGSLVAVTQILTTNQDRSLRLAVWIFAFCLPLLVAMAFKTPLERLVAFRELSPKEVRTFTAFLFVVFIDVVGFACVFFHFGNVSGFAFIASCFVACCYVTNWRAALGILFYPLLVMREKIRHRRA